MGTETERSIEVLHALNEIGAVNLDVLLGRAEEVQSAPHNNGVRVERLGFQVTRANPGERAL